MSLNVPLLEQFITLFVVIDPIGTVPVFIAVTVGLSPATLRKTALLAALISTGILLFFLVAGQFILQAMGIGLESFQIAGGIILFLFALTMIFGESKPEAESHSTYGSNVAVFPLAVPSLASPGAMLAVVLLTDNSRFSIEQQAITAGIVLAVMAIALVLMLLAGFILRIIGSGGAAIVSRVMGMILASVAVNNIIEAVFQLIAARA
ncbi:MAG: MarC family protein [Pseudomonadota bacterium]